MQRFLIVGCGGSGGATLAYMMDQLRSELLPYTEGRLPAGWQFVHIDAPTASEDGPDGLASVQRQGGTYIGAAPQNANYSTLDDAVTRKFSSRGRLDTIATWAPRSPSEVNIPIAVGAGQYRAVGRMITLSRAAEIQKELDRVWEKLYFPDTDAEMRALDVPGLGLYSPGPPIVLVVSSMAGGAGASMALDVCRILTTVGTVDPTMMGVFMVAPNIFDTLPEASRLGVRPNALAMLGEIVASQTGAARAHDAATLAALGIGSGDGVAVPFARVFPVGRFSGIERAQFGDGTARAVYRGLGRGLAGLLMSGEVTSTFVQYDLGNAGASPIGDRNLLGWGSRWEPLPWGSYGFARLSMGRDRYREYAAQRLARTSVDRLLTGHIQAHQRTPAPQQIHALLENRWTATCHDAGLPAAEEEVDRWSRWAFRYTGDEAVAVVRTNVEPNVPQPHGVSPQVYVPALRQRLAELSVQVRRESDAAAVRSVFRWHQSSGAVAPEPRRSLREDIEGQVIGAVAEVSLPYAVALTERLEAHLRDVVAPALERIHAAPRPDVTAVPAELEPMLAELGRRGIATGGVITEKLVTGCRGQVRDHIHAVCAEQAATVLRRVGPEVIAPLRDALREALRTLEDASTAAAVDVGLARLETDQCAAWPSEADLQVPARFDEANNEILLTSSAHFPGQYKDDLCAAVVDPAAGADAPLPYFDDALAAGAAMVTSGRWATAGGRPAPDGLLEQRAAWRPAEFKTDPTRLGERVTLTPSRANYRLHLRPADLLERSRQFVRRPDSSFAIFCKVSIAEFLRSDSESEARERARLLVAKFRETLSLSRPLISVDSEALSQVHDGASIQYRYKFSDVPLKDHPVAAELAEILAADRQRIDKTSSDTFASALSNTPGITHVDVFGSYPNYSPLVFDAVLRPAAQQWAQIPAMGRGPFWQWRRSRPLDASLPMGERERRAMVGGWLIGQLVGRLSVPSREDNRAVRIWDEATGRWIAFPHPLLTPPSRFRAVYDWLPAVLESVLVAIARAHEPPAMTSLRPYQLLRRLWDDTDDEPAGELDEQATSRRLVAEWLTGRITGGGASSLTGELGTLDDRAKAAQDWLDRRIELAGENYIDPDNAYGAPGGKSYSRISDRETASATPIYRDLAPDVYVMSLALKRVVGSEYEKALRSDEAPARPRLVPPGPGPAVPPVPEGDV